MGVVLKIVDSNNQDLHELIGRLDEELMERYPKQGIYGIDFNDPKVNEVTFVIAYHDEKPVGCGAIRPLNKESMELKRFYVDKKLRNKGIASIILAFLEDKSRKMGYKKIKLETGPKQPEAINLYKKFGYYEIDLFGEYQSSNSEYSLCFEKIIS